MLRHIRIKNFIIIDELELDFNRGFSAFTGETGAGKSIIVDALSYLSGSRIDKSIVRKGRKRCFLEAYFDLDDNIIKLLNNMDIEYDDYLIVTRIINEDNKSISKINGQTVNLSFLKDIFASYIDIHSQKDSQYLLKTSNHHLLLDNYAEINDELNELSIAYKKYSELLKKKEAALNNEFSEREYELIKNEILEIEDANLSIEEEEELIIEEKNFKNSQKLIENLTIAIDLFDKEGGIDEGLYNLLEKLDIDNEFINNFHTKISDYYYNLADDMSEIKRYFNNLDFSEERINIIQERLFTYNRIKRKYGFTINKINEYLKYAKNKVEIYENKQDFINNIDNEIKARYDEYLVLASNVSKKRKKAAKKLENVIVDELKGLELPYALFKVNIERTKDNEKGYDDIEFLISLNKGEDLKPLIKVASGGELSRLLLGLKTIFSKLMGIKLVIFDEIDVGVSGKASKAIAIKMREISNNCQVLSITHSAQVASYSDYHYLVSKKIIDDYTLSSVSLLNDEQRINEISMMQFSNINEISIKAAKNLLEEARREN